MPTSYDSLYILSLCAIGFAVMACAVVRQCSRLRSILYGMLVVPVLACIFGGMVFHQVAMESQLSPENRSSFLFWTAVFEGLLLLCTLMMGAGMFMARRSQKREQHMRRIAQEIQFSHAQLETLVNTIDGVLWRRDIDTWSFQSLSAQAEGFLGYTSDEWFSSADFFFSRIHPDDLPEVQRQRKELALEPRRYVMDYRLRARDGSYNWVCENGASIHDTESRLVVCGVLKNINHRYEEAAEAAKAHALQVAAAREAGMAEIAKGVLHNIGNVLNSLNVSAKLHLEGIIASRAANLGKASRLLREHKEDLAPFLTQHPQGRRLPEYLVSVSENLEQENRRFYADAHAMVQHIEHMRDIISLQQVHGRTSAFKESVDLASLMEHALLLDGDILLDAELTIERNYADVPPLLLSKNLLLQILVNLISNARHAVSAAGISERRVTLGISPPTDGRVVLSVADTGCGITESNLGKIFTHGFTTRKEGNGFGLHHACLLAEEMGGMLKAESAGRNLGATFYLTLPATEGPRTTNRHSATGQLKAQLPALQTQPV